MTSFSYIDEFTNLPNTKKTNKKVAGETVEQHLGDDEYVGGQSGLEHDRHVRGVEELDGVSTTLATEPVGLDGDLDTETLEVDDNGENNNSGDEVHDVGETITPECFTESTALVVPGEEEVEERNEGAFEFRSTTGVDGGGRECLPDDGLANVGGNEQGDTRAQTVTLLKELVEKDDNQGCGNELDDQKETDTSTEIAGTTVQSSKHVNGTLTEGNNHGKDCRSKF